MVKTEEMSREDIGSAFISMILNDPRQCLLDLEFSLDPYRPDGFTTLPGPSGILASNLQTNALLHGDGK